MVLTAMLHRCRFYTTLTCALFCLTFLFTTSVNAQEVRVTEIFYDAPGADAGKEYIRITNNGSGTVDLSDLIFSEHDRTHVVRSIEGSETLASGEDAIIVSRLDHFEENYTFSGTVLDVTNFSLNNTGSTIQILIGESLLHSFSYTSEDGGSGDGNSLHISMTDEVTSAKASLNSVETESVSQNTQKKPSPRPSPKKSKELKVDDKKVISRSSNTDRNEKGKIVVTEKKPVSIESEFENIFLASEVSFFAGRAPDDNPLYGVWNFGDGTPLIYGDLVAHVYLFPGKHIISFQEHQKSSEKSPANVVITRQVSVIKPLVRAERIDESLVQFFNDHSFVLDLSHWRLVTETEQFIFPSLSFIPAKGSITIPFITNQIDSLYIVTPGGGQFPASEKEKEKKKPLPKIVSPVVVEEGSDSITPVIDTHPTKPDINNAHMFLVWVSVFVGVLMFSLVPLFLFRLEKKRKMHDVFK